MVLRSVRKSALTLCIGVGLCPLLTMEAAASPKETHKLGVEAISTSRWADAERFFRAAIAERSQEKVNRVLKTAYLPHYYLGVALAEQGFCKTALTSWAESNTQGQIQKSEHAADMSRRQQDCQQQLRQIDAARVEVKELLLRVGDAAASLAALSDTPELAPLWNQGAASFGSRQKNAEKQRADAQKHLEAKSTGNDLERFAQAKTLAGTALSELNATLTDARQRLGELNAATATALEQLEDVEQSARRTLRSISDLAPYPKRLGARVAAVERKLKEIRENKSGSSAQRLTELTSELGDSHRSLRRAARRPPKELAQAVDAFLTGSYADALSLLETPSLNDDARVKPHVCLIRAASQHALWVLGGEQDTSLHDVAIEAITACAEGEATADAPLPLSAKFFSPRFIDFHGATLEAHARAGELATLAELEASGEEGVGGEATATGQPANGDLPSSEATPVVPSSGETPAAIDSTGTDSTGTDGAS